MKRYSCLVADVPWKFGDSLPGPKRGASSHYETMTVEEAEQYTLPSMEEDSILFFWRVASMQEEALRVVRAWGFKVKSEICWIKTTAPMQAQFLGSSAAQEEWRLFTLAFGMGRYVRASHEVCLIATRGRYKVENASTRSVFFAPRGVHSEKPSEFYSIVEGLTRGPRAELFARRDRAPAFDCYGNEVGKLVGRSP